MKHDFEFLMKLYEAYLLDNDVKKAVDKYLGNEVQSVKQHNPTTEPKPLNNAMDEVKPAVVKQKKKTAPNNMLSGLLG